MAFSINQFKTAMVKGGARPNLFEMIIDKPDTIGNGPIQDLKFFCKSASIPESVVPTIGIDYFGQTFKIPGDRTQGEVVITVINDESFNLRLKFEQWMSHIREHDKNTAADDDDIKTLKSEGRLLQYSKDGTLAITYVFRGMMPINISAIQLDWGSSNAIEEFQVTFSIDYWETETI